MKYYELFNSYHKSEYFFIDDESNNFDRYIFYRGELIDPETIVNIKVEKVEDSLCDYDILPTIFTPIVSKKFKHVFSSLENKQLQFLKTSIKDEYGNINNDFYIMNILNVLPCKDANKSIEEEISDGVMYIEELYFMPNCLKDLDIIRMKEETSYIIVNENFKKTCKNAKLKGVIFIEEGEQ